MCLLVLTSDSNAKPNQLNPSNPSNKIIKSAGPKQCKGKGKGKGKKKVKGGTKKKVKNECKKIINKVESNADMKAYDKVEKVDKVDKVEKVDNSNKCKMRVSGHADDRAHERGICIDKYKGIDYGSILKMPIYTTDNGCTKYLDVKNQIVYYVRNKTIETMISTNPIQMLRYYAFGKGLDINKLCRDHACNNCKRSNCKYIHVNFE